MIILKTNVTVKMLSRFLRNNGELKFAFLQVTTKCNARCSDRCSIWASEPFDMRLKDVKFAIDVLAKNGFSIIYFTGGETGLYPYLAEALHYAKKKGMVTSITTNGTISLESLRKLGKSLDILSVSIDHYNESLWDEAKHIAGISKKAKQLIKMAKTRGLKIYGITFLNPDWNVKDIGNIIHYVNEELGISFALSYPYISSNDGTFSVGGDLANSNYQDQQSNLKNMVAKVLEMKLLGADVATVSCYMRDVIRAYDGLPMRYPCNAGKSAIVIDCHLDVFPCYRRKKLFNLRDCQNLRISGFDNSVCDNKFCLINCFKEASLASKQTCLKAVKEELFSNPKFYLKLLRT
jgi:MoaA/NifB/PqqE/SkfB family radical SAM enzyme